MNLEDEDLQFFAEDLMAQMKMQIIYILNKYYGKPYILDSRVKKLDKLRIKQSYCSRKNGYPVELTDLPDIIGFRISVEDEKDVEELNELIKNLLSPSGVIDYFNKPKENGFKAFLCYFDNVGLNTEIQIMTRLMMEWTNATHEEYDNRKYSYKQ